MDAIECSFQQKKKLKWKKYKGNKKKSLHNKIRILFIERVKYFYKILDILKNQRDKLCKIINEIILDWKMLQKNDFTKYYFEYIMINKCK